MEAPATSRSSPSSASSATPSSRRSARAPPRSSAWSSPRTSWAFGRTREPMDRSVLYEVRDGVATISLNRPEVLNALDQGLTAQLADHAEAAARDPEVWVVVVRGNGRAFCSGMDRKALAAGKVGEAFYRHWIRALNCFEDMDKLVIGVLHGYSIGGGLQLAVACDLRLATEDAVLGLGRRATVSSPTAPSCGLPVSWVSDAPRS